MILGIDPGACTGWARVSSDGRLMDAGVGSPAEVRAMFGAIYIVGVDRAVIELPQVYRAARSKGDPNDLIDLAVTVGRYVQILESRAIKVVLVKPRDWKGQVPKEVHHKRILARLSTEEVARLPKLAASKVHNMLDAVGLALWFAEGRK